MSEPLYVALIWHMHQPYYGNGSERGFSLPWTRLHATKDYLHMAETLARFPRMHATVNLVPSLIEQLTDYVNHHRTDRSLSTSLKDEWTAEDREYMLSFFFSANWERFIRPHPAYDQLLQIRERARAHPQFLSDQYFRDLVGWFNLVWIDPNWLEREPELCRLVKQGSGFSPDDIRSIIGVQEDILSRILPAYRSLEEQGQIEICTSPYYHPILPLLIDSHCARESSPGMTISEPAFAHPEDALEQINRAIDSHRQYFGQRPRGMWPPEGGVSDALVLLLTEHTDIAWIASDEGVLAASTGQEVHRDEYGHVTNPRFLYQPYRLQSSQEGLPAGPTILFRDNLLSDRIGFVYQRMDGHHAAQDLVGRLHRVRESLDGSGPHIVSIILDGENCWEEYEHNGDTFLNSLYGLLSNDPLLETVTVSEYLSAHPVQATIPRLSAGSWIGRNFETWIGEPTQNQAWARLARTRGHLTAWQAQCPHADTERLEQAWNEIYIAEGSDWFWWYSSRNRAAEETVFDASFRHHLQNVYRLTETPIPEWLLGGRPQQDIEIAERSPSAFISPALDADSPALPRWESAGYTTPRASTGAMQTAVALIKRFYYGHDHEHLFARIESHRSLQACTLSIFLSPAGRLDAGDCGARAEMLDHPLSPGQCEIRLQPASQSATLHSIGPEGQAERTTDVPLSLTEHAAELRIALKEAGAALGEILLVRVVVTCGDTASESIPVSGNLAIRLSRYDH